MYIFIHRLDFLYKTHASLVNKKKCRLELVKNKKNLLPPWPPCAEPNSQAFMVWYVVGFK